MTDIPMWNHMQDYRLKWYRAKKAVEENDRTEASPHQAHVNFHLKTEQWVFRLLPLDEVENVYQEIWHNRQFGEYSGLTEVHENALRVEGFELENPLPVDLLTQIGKAAEEITVDVMDLPEQPPVDIDPWEPDTQLLEEISEQYEEFDL